MKKRKKLPPYATNFLGQLGNSRVEVPDEDVEEYFGKVKDQETLRAAIIEYYGPRCGGDASSYLNTPEQGICGCCEAWLAFDRFTGSTVYPAAVIDGL